MQPLGWCCVEIKYPRGWQGPDLMLGEFIFRDCVWLELWCIHLPESQLVCVMTMVTTVLISGQHLQTGP